MKEIKSILIRGQHFIFQSLFFFAREDQAHACGCR